jgi:hypothetical protein
MEILPYIHKYHLGYIICMAKMIFHLDDEKEKKFRDTVIKVKGFRKGVIKESLEEEINAWIEEQKKSKKGNAS